VEIGDSPNTQKRKQLVMQVVGDSNIKFCILCYLLAFMGGCILYARG